RGPMQLSEKAATDPLVTRTFRCCPNHETRKKDMTPRRIFSARTCFAATLAALVAAQLAHAQPAPTPTEPPEQSTCCGAPGRTRLVTARESAPASPAQPDAAG